VTDARGITTNFSYNNRHLVTNVSYDRHSLASVPTEKAGGATGTTDVADTPAVTYQYDAVGNRTSMTTAGGAGGSCTYSYDALSRLTSEARQFLGLAGTYTLNYDYTIDGQLKQVTDVAAGRSFANTFDAAGQLTQVTGTGYTTAQQTFASGMQYRAWGAVKGLSYGNGTSLALTYDGRGQVTHYGVNGVTRDGQYGPPFAHGSDYQYYADGRVQYASDLFTDVLIYGNYRMHDRAYSYDQMGRLKEAYSGHAANQFMTGVDSNQAGVDGAYRQSYSYDVWSNMTGRTGGFWSVVDNDAESYDTRGRNLAWEYDGDGRLISRNEPAPDTLPYVPLRQSYDAAGRLTLTTQTTSTRDPINQNIIHTGQNTRTETYDGDGVGIMEGTIDATTYYLRSSALGGQVIAEYDPQGVRQNEYVYAGGVQVVRQSGGQTSSLFWQHRNPITSDTMETDAQGAVTGKETLDPIGVNVGDSDPFIVPPGGGDDGGGGNGDHGLSQAEMDQRYAQLLPHVFGGRGLLVKVNGMETSAYFAFGLLGMGAAEFARPNVVNIYDKSLGKYVGYAYLDRNAAADGIAFLGKNSTGYIPFGVNYVEGEGFTGTNLEQWFVEGTWARGRVGETFMDIGSFRELYGFADQGVGAAQSPLPGIRGGASGATKKREPEPPPYMGPCPPTKEQLAANQVVKRTLDEAMKRAQDLRVEHGGWILWNAATGQINAIIKEPKIDPLNPKTSDNFLQVYLNNPPSTPKGWFIVGTFHMHLGNIGEDDADIAIDDGRKVPGMVRTTDGKIHPYGHHDRGIWNRDLPKRCR